MPDNRRRFFRVRASLRFTFAWEGGFELYRTADLSACGAAIHLPPELAAKAPRVGTIGECAFNLESMEIRAVARRRRRTNRETRNRCLRPRSASC